tara:strand:- start:451 stop:702 length:252 start_codon:yes stop_codon:yes gene_type:complete
VEFNANDLIMMNDIEARVHGIVHDITQEYGSDCALAIPAILLKVTLQIYKHIMVDDTDIEKIIMSSVESMKDIPPLIKRGTIH